MFSSLFKKQATRWRAVGRTVRGTSHERADLPNQDALDWEPKDTNDPIVIMSLSDGHGSAKSFRSNTGSHFAVDVAMYQMSQFLKNRDKEELTPSAIKRAGEDALPQAIVREWRSRVISDIAEFPFSDAELDRLKGKDGDTGLMAIEKNPALAYGATILCVAVTEEFILYTQLGDGDILNVSASGEVSRPLMRDERLFANETTSLCSPDAWKDFRTHFQVMSGAPPALILLATDGYSNSFRDETGFLKVGSDINEMIVNDGWNSVTSNLEAWLYEASRDGSGDDITVGLVSPSD